MKKVSIFLCLLTSLSSCEKFDGNPVRPNTDFSHQILEGYFVTSIAFDHQGNAWIGTFKQGLIKYNPSGITLYKSTNSIIPDTSVIHVWLALSEVLNNACLAKIMNEKWHRPTFHLTSCSTL